MGTIKEFEANGKRYDIVEDRYVNPTPNFLRSYQIGLKVRNSNSSILRFCVDFSQDYLKKYEKHFSHGFGDAIIHNEVCCAARKKLLEDPDYAPQEGYIHHIIATKNTP